MKLSDGMLHARVAAPPVDGAANRALIALLSDHLGIPKSRITIQSGESARVKVLRLEGLEPEALDRRLAALRDPA